MAVTRTIMPILKSNVAHWPCTICTYSHVPHVQIIPFDSPQKKVAVVVMVVNRAHGHSSQVTRIHSQLANKAIMFVTVTCLVFLPFLFARSIKSVACSLPTCNSKNNQDT